MAQLVRAPPCHGGGHGFEPHSGRRIFREESPYFARSIAYRGLSSAGRASALQAEGHRFEPYRPHIESPVPFGTGDSAYVGVVELADTQDLKSCGLNLPYGFDPRRRQDRGAAN